MVRVAVLQIERSSVPEEILAVCLAQIERAVAQHRAEILVCPEISWSSNEEGTLGLDDLRRALHARARAHGVWIALSAICRSEGFCGWLGPDASDGPDVEGSDEVSASGGAVVVTPHGRIGMCAGRSILQTARARELALQDATLICAPAGVCSAAQAAVHLAARALENRVFVALAASFEPPARPYPAESVTLPPAPMDSARAARGVTSQILGPNGRPLAVAVVEEAGIAVAELDLNESNHKALPDGTSFWALRRPDLYRSTVVRARTQAATDARGELSVATLDVPFRGVSSETLEVAAAKLEVLAQQAVDLVVLPELFCFGLDLGEGAEAVAQDFLTIVRTLARACRGTRSHVVTSLVEAVSGELTHVGLVIGQAGIVARQVQLHVPRRHAWARPGRRLENIRMPWGNLAIAVGDDALMPELAGCYAALGTDLLAAPLAARFHAEGKVTLPALADQLQIAVVAALRGNREADEEDLSESLIVDPRRWPAPKAIVADDVCQTTITMRRLGDAPGLRRAELAWEAATG